LPAHPFDHTVKEETSPMATKSYVLARRLEAKVQEALATLGELGDADWKKVTEAEQWPVGVTAHHLAGALEPISHMIEAVAAGQAPCNLSVEMLDEMNAQHARDHADCTRAETIELLRKGAAVAAATIRRLSDEQLATSGTVLVGLPPMTVEQLITSGLLDHVDEHFGSIRATVGHRVARTGPSAAALVAPVAPADTERAIGAIVLAFVTDPAARWTFADPGEYLTHFPVFVRAFGARAFAQGTAHHVGGFAGAALWLPPGTEADEEMLVAVLRRSVATVRQAAVFAVIERMGRHHPREPHWYLPLIGVDPAHQRKGHGSALLEYALARCDLEHAPAYLESTSPESVRLYERYGFEVLGTVQVGSSPPIVPMLRRAR
jgi:ribosomal protein S18 acetylase RimI-like enzyme